MLRIWVVCHIYIYIKGEKEKGGPFFRAQLWALTLGTRKYELFQVLYNFFMVNLAKPLILEL